MSNLAIVLDYFDILAPQEMPEEVKKAYQDLRKQLDKPAFTAVGKQILEYLQSRPDDKLKVKDIADGLGESSRKINGAMRKLVNDSYVDKFGSSPVSYLLTDKGKNLNLMNEGENNHEE